MVPLGEMSPVVKAAFIATEDKRFYQHDGIDWYRVLGAIRSNLIEMRVAEGFSTITMQLARNIWTEDISGRDKSLRRKLREAGWRRRSRTSTPRTRSWSCISTRSISAIAPSGSRRRPSATSGSRSATSTSPKPPRSPRFPRPRRATTPGRIRTSASSAATRCSICCATTGCSARRRPSGGNPTRCCSPPAPTTAARRSISWSSSGSSSTRASARISTARATGSTPPSTSIPSRRPSARWRPGSRRSRAAPTASSSIRPIRNTRTRRPTRPTARTASRRRISRAWR